jgi:hypothetical protein
VAAVWTSDLRRQAQARLGCGQTDKGTAKKQKNGSESSRDARWRQKRPAGRCTRKRVRRRPEAPAGASPPEGIAGQCATVAHSAGGRLEQRWAGRPVCRGCATLSQLAGTRVVHLCGGNAVGTPSGRNCVTVARHRERRRHQDTEGRVDGTSSGRRLQASPMPKKMDRISGPCEQLPQTPPAPPSPSIDCGARTGQGQIENGRWWLPTFVWSSVVRKSRSDGGSCRKFRLAIELSGYAVAAAIAS